MLITLQNVRNLQSQQSEIIRRRITGNNSRIHYMLQKDLFIELSNGQQITIFNGFIWDLSSVPRFLWGILPPDGDFELASLIHDYLYITKIVTREFADKEMLIWSKATSGTYNKISIRNLDNQLRYIAVRLFGWIVWNRPKKF